MTTHGPDSIFGDMPPGMIAFYDQLKAHTNVLIGALIAAYLDYQQAYDADNQQAVDQAYANFVAIIKRAQEGDAGEVTTAAVISMLCHAIYSMIWVRHGASWQEIHDAIAREELYMTKADLALFKVNQGGAS